MSKVSVSETIGGGGSSTDRISTNEAFELLSNERRRYVLHDLKQRDRRTEIGDLSERVASWENDTSIDEVNSDERKRVYTSLQQFHLPKLDEKGIVQFDQRTGTVTLTESAEDLDVYLEVVRGGDVPWSQYYLGLGAVNAALAAVVALGVWPFVLLPDVAWMALMIATLVVSGLAHTYVSSSHRLGGDGRPPGLRK